MATPEPREFFTYGDHCCSITLNSPIPDTENCEDSADPLLRAVVGALAKHATGLAGCLNYAIELDASAYTVHIVGTPIELSRMDGTHSGFTLHISIFPRFAVGDCKKDGGLVDDNGYGD